jgi:glutamine synthetase
MPDSMLVFAPNANSWRRFVSNAYAPTAPSWGANNRSVALRVPAGPAASRRIEHRPAGVDANPYLVAAAVLAGIGKGLEEKLNPGPETVGDGYAGAQPAAALPGDWREAISQAEASSFLKEALTPELHKVLLAIKRSEHAMVSRTVTELDYRLYLHEV